MANGEPNGNLWSPANITRLGVGTVFGLIAMYLLYKVLVGGLTDLSKDVNAVKAKTDSIMLQHESFKDVNQELIKEVRRQTKVQERICVTNSIIANRPTADCILPE